MIKEVDPITLQVIGGALHSIAEQMGNVLYRMSYSSIIRESQDLGAGLFDCDYNTLCEWTPPRCTSVLCLAIFAELKNRYRATTGSQATL